MLRPRPVFAPYLAEALGTFALVFAGPGATAVDAESGGAVGGVGVGLSFHVFEKAVITRDQLAVAHAQDRDAGIVPIARESKHVAITAPDAHDDSRVFHRFQRAYRIAQDRRALEVEGSRCALHHLRDPANDLPIRALAGRNGRVWTWA